ncbi:Cysteine-rich repeat secretory protein 38 [Camellia lanceoleosa]|uniref:Cysteine-rich repeat secretory protein 38 n=1 Tax=Camellia lanceoleosa TaxID=1840588 RepID=A0ACC0HBP9_9ERIC|nr:Cysteine-rich repeat secretory protein 38 [Camellia lanceoleosa]
MSSSTFTSSLYLLSFTLLIEIVIGVNPLFHFCSSPENFTANSPYESNLNKLMSYLYLKTPPTGFGVGSVGQYHDIANGLSLCRGDVNSTDCAACVAEASSEIRKRCPYNKGSVIWYDNCLVKYSNTDFFGKIDNGNRFYMWNLRNLAEYSRIAADQTQIYPESLSITDSSSRANAVPNTGSVEEKIIDGERKVFGRGL